MTNHNPKARMWVSALRTALGEVNRASRDLRDRRRSNAEPRAHHRLRRLHREQNRKRETYLVGWVDDQARLNGLLELIGDLTIELVSVNRIAPDGRPSRAPLKLAEEDFNA